MLSLRWLSHAIWGNVYTIANSDHLWACSIVLTHSSKKRQLLELDIFWTVSGHIFCQLHKDYLVFLWILDLQILSLFASLQLRQLFYSCLLCELVDALCWCRYRSFGQHFNNAIQVLNHKMCWPWWGGLWQYRLWSFQGSDTELEKFFS